MTAAVIHLSDRVHEQEKAEPRMEATVFVNGTRHAARAMRHLVATGDLLGAVRVAKQLEAMCETADKRIDELTREVARWEGDPA